MSIEQCVNPRATGRPKRILSLDGGGIRGVFSLQVLARIEKLLREDSGNPGLVLADEFDLIAGTSTGAIIATLLSWGLSVADIEGHYLAESKRMFVKSSWSQRLKTTYTATFLTGFFQRVFSEDGDGRVPALLGSDRLRTLLLLVMRNASTGSAWPVSNNPGAKYNDRALADCNLNVPLWQLVRASTAAPTYFKPEQITLGKDSLLFVDGGITPYNNPSFIAFLTATLPSFRIGWKTGADRLQVVSVGTGRSRPRLLQASADSVSWIDAARYVAPALLDSVAMEQDLMCRTVGRCVFGDPIDSEIGPLTGNDGVLPLAERKFTYVRYNHRFTPDEESTLRAGGAADPFALDNVRLIPALVELGKAYAMQVQPEHLGLGAGRRREKR